MTQGDRGSLCSVDSFAATVVKKAAIDRGMEGGKESWHLIYQPRQRYN